MTAKTNNKPARTLRDQTIKAAIWRNVGDKGAFYSVTFSRSYRDETGEWRDAESFSGSDLLRLALLAQESYRAVAKLRAEDKDAAEQDEAA